ncbi:MAG: hypothetical protein PF485_03720 [Bacteroidales bacterium]|jgi:hypothetical protein|nr:hypothetical protein [Bacteroidales bacterium]
MKKIILLLSVSLILSSGIKAQKSVGIDIYPIPMLFGEFGFQVNLPAGIGAHLSYYNPSVGLTGVLIQSQLGDGDELNLNVHSVMPGISYTYYSKGNIEGFYVGGKFLFKTVSGDVLLKDKYTGGTAYKGIVESEISINSINVGCIAGYRFVFDNNFTIRLGAALGYQNALKNEVTYRIIEQYDDEGWEVVDDLREDLEMNTESFTKPVTFQIEIGLGFNF